MERCLGCDNSLVTEPKMAVAMTAGGATRTQRLIPRCLTLGLAKMKLTTMISSGVALRRDDHGQVIIRSGIATRDARHDPGHAHRRHQTMDGTRLFNQWFDDYSLRNFKKIFVV